MSPGFASSLARFLPVNPWFAKAKLSAVHKAISAHEASMQTMLNVKFHTVLEKKI